MSYEGRMITKGTKKVLMVGKTGSTIDEAKENINRSWSLAVSLGIVDAGLINEDITFEVEEVFGKRASFEESYEDYLSLGGVLNRQAFYQYFIIDDKETEEILDMAHKRMIEI